MQETIIVGGGNLKAGNSVAVPLTPEIKEAIKPSSASAAMTMR